MARFTEEAGIVPHFAREEAERRHQYYLGPQHLLLGLLVGDENPMVRGLRAHGLNLQVGDDNPAARVLRAHGLDLETVRAGIDRLVAQGVLPGPQQATPSCWPPWGSTWTRSWRIYGRHVLGFITRPALQQALEERSNGRLRLDPAEAE